MDQAVTHAEELTVEVVAHADETGKYLLISLSAPSADAADKTEEPPIDAAIVVDRSGSMDGPKLNMVVRATSELIRTLRPTDTLSVVAFDEEVRVLAERAAPSERLAAEVARITSGGCTNLYGGWVKGAKLVRSGGRVILLSDGLANQGRYTQAHELASHAGISYSKYNVTTSTIGVGSDYDERLMAGMAREGGGTHYFAKGVEAIMEAFSQERFSLASEAFSFLSVKYEGRITKAGHLWAGETKRVLIPVSGLQAPPATLRFTVKSTGETHTVTLAMPDEFGRSHRAGLERLLSLASSLHRQALEVNDSQAAGRLKNRMRDLCLEILSHPLADEPEAKAAVENLELSIEQLERLERRFEDEAAILYRKRSLQYDFNLRERAKAFSAFEEDRESIELLFEHFAPPMDLRFDPAALALAPLASWRGWMTVPVKLTPFVVCVAVTNPKDRFNTERLEREVGFPVRPVLKLYREVQLLQAFDEFERAQAN